MKQWVPSILSAVFLFGSALAVQAEQVKLDVSPAYSVMKADQKQTAWMRVGMTGFKLESEKERAPVNLALVLDRSGSMQGEKMVRAREAAIDAVKRLKETDIVSVLAYADGVTVLVPATKLTDKDFVIAQIQKITADGSTALFAGVSKGAAEVRKFQSDERVNRVILLSDGKANVGPSSPSELGTLGESLRKENITVSTFGLGLGYNEDLMVQLASHSGGNHEFVESAAALAKIFEREFNDVTSVVAQNVKVEMTIPEGIRPVRVLGNDAEINGQEILIDMAQIYSEQNKFVVVEVELPSHEAGEKMKLADVSLAYKNMKTSSDERLSVTSNIAFDTSDDKVKASLNRAVMEDVVLMVANEQSKLATVQLDEGDVASCRRILISNGHFIEDNAKLLKSKKLERLYIINGNQTRQIEGRELNRARKSLRAAQSQVDSQQPGGPASAAP